MSSIKKLKKDIAILFIGLIAILLLLSLSGPFTVLDSVVIFWYLAFSMLYLRRKKRKLEEHGKGRD